MRRGEPLPLVWLGTGALADPTVLVRYASLLGILVPVGPVVAPQSVRRDRRTVLAGGVGGVDHLDAAGITLREATELLSWCSTRDLRACVSVRGRTTGELADVISDLRRGLDADRAAAVEVDLREADQQVALKAMSRVREAAPRDHLLLAKVHAAQPDLVGVARSAVAGGAGAVVLSGQTRLGEGHWWSGPSTLAATLAGLRELTAAAEDRRWPAVPLLAAGGVHDAASARSALECGADAVQLGTALWADPTALDRIRAELEPRPGEPPSRPTLPRTRGEA